MRRVLVTFIIACVLISFFSPSVFAGQLEVVTLGADLSAEQRKQVLNWFGVQEEEVQILEITNAEEREYLEGLATEELIGINAISSAHVELLSKGTGIKVKTNNITWVTEEMYANALITAGVENAAVNITAPFKVSGTAALTGVMKAFEKAAGKKISTEAKEAANEELFVSIELGDDIGNEKAVEIIQEIKRKVVEDKIKDPDDIREVIEMIAKELDITLTEAQVEQILALMEKISRLDLDINKIGEQLDKISVGLEDLRKTVKENKDSIQKILDVINAFFAWLRQIFSA
ncbi:MAG: DUF1002 domain-containing protein [Firmicutes bacterium]|nr:DUF1002 domain-containing protein [Bacillota bacterium]